MKLRLRFAGQLFVSCEVDPRERAASRYPPGVPEAVRPLAYLSLPWPPCQRRVLTDRRARRPGRVWTSLA
jgi:hypothetical protein